MKLDGLQAGRAVAALMVVAFHANAFILPDRLYDGATAGRVFNMGYAGVEFFFVLSGFIMVFVHQRDFSRPDRVGSFLTKRIFRIYPVYWVIYGALTAIYFLAPGRGPDHARDVEAIVSSALLFPMPEQPVMQVAWTLQHEMLFYLVFALLVLNLRLGILIFAIWMGACMAAGLGALSYPLDFLLSPYNLLFLMGIWAALRFRDLSPGQGRTLLLAGAILFLGTGLVETFGLVEWWKPARTWSYGLGATAMVMGLAAGAIQPPRWLSFLGDASYAIYLVHLPAMSFGSVIALKLGAPWGLPPLVAMAGLVLLSSVAGAAVHLGVERPIARWLTMKRTETALRVPRRA